MSPATLLFKPDKKGIFNKSPIYTVLLFSKILAHCTKFVSEAMQNRADVKLTDEYIDRFWRINFEETKTSLYVTGRELLKASETYVFMSNHESWMDIPAVFGAVPSSLRMVAKLGLMKIPIFGRALNSGGFIFVDRKNRARAIRQLEIAKERLNDGISIWIAPEGTRSRKKEIGSFKKGGFYLASQLQRPIVPVYIEGAFEVMPPDSPYVYPNRAITVHFCEPIETVGYGKDNLDELVLKVRNAIIQKKIAVEKLGDTHDAQISGRHT